MNTETPVMCLRRSFRFLIICQNRSREVCRLKSPETHGWVGTKLVSWCPKRRKGARGPPCCCISLSRLGDNLEILCQKGQLDSALSILVRMDHEDIVPSVGMYRALLKSCTKRKSLVHAKRVHAHLARHGLEAVQILAEDVVITLVKCGGLEDATQLFYRLSNRNVFCWTALIAGYVNSGQGQESLAMYRLMQEEGVQPNARTFVSLLKACGSLRDLNGVKQMHAEVLRYKFETDVFVRTCLIAMYGKCGSVEDAEEVFDKSLKQDVVAWNAMLTVYVEQGHAKKVLQLYERMQKEAVHPDSRTFVSTFQACGMLAEKPDMMDDSQLAKARALDRGKLIHADARRTGHDLDVFVGNTLISMYSKCGSVVDAENVFHVLPQRNVVTWTSMMGAYVEQRLPERAVLLYEQMRDEGLSLTSWTIVTALQACGMLADEEKGSLVVQNSTKRNLLDMGTLIHIDATRMGLDSDIFVCNTLVSMYGKCGSISDAEKAFDRMSQRNVVTWTAMLGAYLHQGQAERALKLFEKMRIESVSPDNRTFVAALQACGMLAEREEAVMVDGRPIKVRSLRQVEIVHANAQEKGYGSDLLVVSTLISMYGRCGSAFHAQNVFDRLSHRNSATWYLMISIYVEQGLAGEALQLYEQMCSAGVVADSRIFVSVLQACGMLAEQEHGVFMDGRSVKVNSLRIGRRIHAESQAKGYNSDVFISNTLISMYGKCGSVADAESVFERLLQRDVVSWNAMLSAYVEQGQAAKALELFEKMQAQGECANQRTFVSALQACMMLMDVDESCEPSRQLCKLKLLEQVTAIHALSREKGYHADVFVGSALVNVYGKCGRLADAQKVFDALPQHDVVSWNVLLMVHVELGDVEKALQLYGQMQVKGANPDKWTFVNALRACAVLADNEEGTIINGLCVKADSLKLGEVIHVHAHRKDYDSDVFVSSALVLMYGKCGSIVDAQNVFDRLSYRDATTWNVMIAAYVKQRQGEKALALYREMQDGGTSPDSWTFVSALQACRAIADNEESFPVNGRLIKLKALEQGAAIHADTQKKCYSSDVFVGSSLISMYGRCGSVEDAQNVFKGLSQRNVVTWNAMLTTYIEHGQGERALQLYEQMLVEGVGSDEITALCILQACAETGNLAMLRHFHHTLECINSPLLLNTLVHVYGRCGSMIDAETVFDALPRPDVVSWNTLIAAYARQGNCPASLLHYARMQKAGVNPDGVTFLSLLLACNHAGLVDQGVEIFESMSTKYDIWPEIEHYVSVVDLFGRAGCFTRLRELLASMPLQPNIAMWLCVLGACRNHGELVLGEEAFNCAVRLEPEHPSPYVLMANIYADAGLFDHANRVKKMRRKQGAWKLPGQSWIEHEQELHIFLVRDTRHAQRKQVYDILRSATSEVIVAGWIQAVND